MLNQKQLKALERLTEKLNVVRKSLRGDERILFDQIMASATFEAGPEVAPHLLRGAEVAAHAQTAAVARGQLAAPEVVAHALQEGAVAALTLSVLKNTLKVTLK